MQSGLCYCMLDINYGWGFDIFEFFVLVQVFLADAVVGTETLISHIKPRVPV